MGGRDESRFGEKKGDWRTRKCCRQPESALNFARRVEISSSFDFTDGIGACETYRSENVPIVVIEMTNRTKRQANLAAE